MKSSLIAVAALALAQLISSVCEAENTPDVVSVPSIVADCDATERLPEFVRKRGDPVFDNTTPWVDDCCPM